MRIKDCRMYNKKIQMLREQRDDLLEYLYQVAAELKRAGFPATSETIKDKWARESTRCVDIDKALS